MTLRDWTSSGGDSETITSGLGPKMQLPRMISPGLELGTTPVVMIGDGQAAGRPASCPHVPFLVIKASSIALSLFGRGNTLQHLQLKHACEAEPYNGTRSSRIHIFCC
jgi:hypothetical protein